MNRFTVKQVKGMPPAHGKTLNGVSVIIVDTAFRYVVRKGNNWKSEVAFRVPTKAVAYANSLLEGKE